MDFLELAQRLQVKCRVSGSGPVAVTGQNAEYQRLILYVNEAWMEIQRLHTDWRFMRQSCSCTTVTGQALYDPVVDFGLTDFGYWALDYQSGDTFRNYNTAAGVTSEIFMDVWDYDNWRDAYKFGAIQQTYTRPVVVAKAPNNFLACGPIPIEGYTLRGDYYQVPTELVDATDTPSLPVQFHMAIVYKAMMYYGLSEAAPEIYDDGEQHYNRIIREAEFELLRRARLMGGLC